MPNSYKLNKAVIAHVHRAFKEAKHPVSVGTPLTWIWQGKGVTVLHPDGAVRVRIHDIHNLPEYEPEPLPNPCL